MAEIQYFSERKRTTDIQKTTSGPRVLAAILGAGALLMNGPLQAELFAYVANLGSNTVSVIDTATNELVGQPISVGSPPRALGVTPDGSRVYVVNGTFQGTLAVIDTSSRIVVGQPITVGSGPLAIAMTPDGKSAYVPNFFGAILRTQMPRFPL